MDTEDYEYSIASQIAYDYYYNEMDYDKTQETLDAYMPGYEIDDELSTLNHVVIKRPDDSAILAYRGTDPSNPHDLMADIIIAGGTHRDPINLNQTRFNLAEQYYQNAISKYGAVDLTGHSLGGSLSDYVASKYGAKSTIFNPGASPFEVLREELKPSVSKVYKTDTLDLLSLGARQYSNIIEVPQNVSKLNPIGSHSLTNFLPSQDILPLDFSAPLEIIPSIPITKEEKKEIIKEENIQQQLICDLQPELAPSVCRPKLKLKQQQVAQETLV